MILQTAGHPSSWTQELTGEDGRARFERVPASPLVVRWSPAQEERDLLGGIRVVRSPDALGPLTLRRAVPLGGQVVAESGAPVAAVTLRASPVAVGGLEARPSAELFTSHAPDGRFSIRVAEGTGWWITRPPEGGRADDAIAARWGPFVAGQEDIRIVVDAPSAGARITGTARWADERAASGWVFFLRELHLGETLDRAPHVAVAADGTFRSPVLLAGVSYDVVVRNDHGGRIGNGWGLARGVPAGNVGVVVVAHPGRTLSGMVVDGDGKPVDLVRVRPTARLDVAVDPFHRLVLTTPAGDFAFQDAPPFPVHVTAGGAGTHWHTPDPVLVPEGFDGALLLAVHPTVAVAGRLVFEDGTPARGQLVAGKDWSEDVRSDGTFRLEGFVPGDARIAWTPDASLPLAPLHLDPVVAPADDVTLVVRIPE